MIVHATRSFLLAGHAALLAAIALCLQGCIGKDTVVFATTTTAGVNIDTKPPTVHAGWDRLEGVFEPVFENGATPPVLASARADGEATSKLWGASAGSVFATGQPAVAVGTLYTDADFKPYTVQGGNLQAKTIDGLDGTIELGTTKPDFSNAHFVEPGGVRPVFFGTDTNLGVKVAWSGMTATLPDSLVVGYRRKEMAVAPLSLSTKTTNNATTYQVHSPSLLATIDTGGHVGAALQGELQISQYFATGKAAERLVLRQDVRKALAKRLDPNQDVLIGATAFGMSLGGDNTETARSLIVNLTTTARTLAAQQNALGVRATAVLKGLNDSASDLVPPKYAFAVVNLNSAGNGYTVIKPKDQATAVTDFNGVMGYWGDVIETQKSLNGVFSSTANPPPAVTDGAGANVSIKDLMTNSDATKKAEDQVRKAVLASPAVQKLVEFFFRDKAPD